MNESVLKDLRPDPRALAFPACPEVEAALQGIQKAHDALVEDSAKAREELARTSPPGVNDRQTKINEGWRLWEDRTLRPFNLVRRDASARVVEVLQVRVEAERLDLGKRTDALGAGLGHVLGDAAAGRDLLLLLQRWIGALPIDQRLHDALRQWTDVHASAKRELVAQPRPVATKPTPETKEAARSALADVLNNGKDVNHD